MVKKPTMEQAKNPPGLVGRGFHRRTDDGYVQQQGAVLADLEGGYYLVQLFEWFSGCPSTQHVLHLDEFAEKLPDGGPRYQFFDNTEDMKSHYENVDSYLNEMTRRECNGGDAAMPPQNHDQEGIG